MVPLFPSVLQLLPECSRTPVNKTHTLAEYAEGKSFSAYFAVLYILYPGMVSEPSLFMRASSGSVFVRRGFGRARRRFGVEDFKRLGIA
jgi:hypothetical protein